MATEYAAFPVRGAANSPVAPVVHRGHDTVAAAAVAAVTGVFLVRTVGAGRPAHRTAETGTSVTPGEDAMP
ncbi:hypothetical protein [Nocardia spumae]|uniref:hypothetical protein n=1 Tax=Nocardia spumae TaxID=2887190 RepID=UPI001D13D268|nr:hypothetical protein [Nocardia spumae]